MTMPFNEQVDKAVFRGVSLTNGALTPKHLELSLAQENLGGTRHHARMGQGAALSQKS